MEKNFDRWNENKKKIHDINKSKLYHEREVWWCSLGVNIGFEQDGHEVGHQRPVLILKGLSKYTCMAIPLTSSIHKHPMRVPIGIVDGKEASAVISQIRVIDTKRLVNKVCFLAKDSFELTRKAIKDIL